MQINYDRLQPLSARELSMIHDATVEILQKKGMWFESEHALEYFRKHGFKVDGGTVYFNSKDIEDALSLVPKEFTIVARNPEHNIVMNENTCSIGIGRSAPFVVELDGSRREATKEDFINFAKLAQSLDEIEHWGPLVIPNDIHPDNARLFMQQMMVKYLDKPYNLFDPASLPVICIAFGITTDKMKEDMTKGIAYGQTTINPISPLVLSMEQCENLIGLGSCGIPLIIAPMPAAGTTAPCTIPGLLVQQNCEILGTLVLAQLVNPGVPVIYGTIGSNTDMRTMSAIYGSPETRLIEYASAQIARFYGLMTRGDVGLTDSLTSDFQSGAESFFQFYNTVRAGINFLPGCGHLASFLGGSYAKVVLDAEIARYVLRLCQPMEFNRETLATDLILKVGPKGQYVTEPHTFKHFKKEFYNPMVFSRLPYEKWIKEGHKEAKIRAHEKAMELIENYQQPELDKETENDLDKYVAANWPVK